MLNFFAGRQRGTEPPPYFGKAVIAVDNTIHMVVLSDAPRYRLQLFGELRRLGLYREMQLWREYFNRRDTVRRHCLPANALCAPKTIMSGTPSGIALTGRDCKNLQQMRAGGNMQNAYRGSGQLAGSVDAASGRAVS